LGVFVEDGQKAMIMLSEGREGRGWRCVTGELSKALGFLEATTVLSFGVPSPVGKIYGIKVGPRVDMGVPSYAAVL
jgi:hypothetical protein